MIFLQFVYFHIGVKEVTATYQIYISDQSYRSKEPQDLVVESHFKHLKVATSLPLPKL